ncbi:MAG: SulP family inorganic anion transporter [Methylococcales bacterium]
MSTHSEVDGKGIKGDIFGGVTAGIVALPLALAFGVQSGMGAIAGLYGAIALGILAAWFGGTRTQISGPTGPMTVVSSVVIATAIETHGSLSAAMGIILAIFLLAGVMEILMGVFKIGQYIRYMPYPVVSGFMSGIGVIIIILQIFPFLGYVSPKKIVDIFTELPTILAQVNPTAIAVAVSTIAIIYLSPRISKAVPSPLVALIVVTAVSTVMNLNVSIIGDIPEGLPKLQLGALGTIGFSDFSLIFLPALTLAALGAIDSLLTSIVADNMTKTQHQSNKELIGQGIGNIGAAMIGGIPGAGATMRTVVNINSGGHSRISGVIHGILLLVILLGAGTYARLIPLPVLAGILITVGIGIIDYKGIKHLFNVPRTDAIIMIIVLLMTVFVDLLQAVAVGMVMASVLFMKKMSDVVEQESEVTSLKDFKQESGWGDESIIPADLAEKIFVKHFDGPIFFGFASAFQSMTRALPEVEVVIMRMPRVPYIDQSGLYAIEDAIMAMQQKNITVLMTGVQEQPLDMLKKVGIVPELVAETHLFEDFPSCVKQLEAIVEGELENGSSRTVDFGKALKWVN